MILPRTTLFHTPSKSPQSQPQSQNQTPPPSPPSTPESWSFTTSIPVSYRIAIFLDASILLLTLAILLGLVLYIRNRRPASHKTHRPVGISIGEEEEETLLESQDAYTDSDLDSGSRVAGEMSQKRRPTPIRIPRPGPMSPGILSPSCFGKDGEKKKKGHVRWTPSVQGGEAFGIPNLEGGGNGKGKEKEEDGGTEGKNCKCRGRRHPGCWRFELQFEGGTPVPGEAR